MYVCVSKWVTKKKRKIKELIVIINRDKRNIIILFCKKKVCFLCCNRRNYVHCMKSYVINSPFPYRQGQPPFQEFQLMFFFYVFCFHVDLIWEIRLNELFNLNTFRFSSSTYSSRLDCCLRFITKLVLSFLSIL